MKLFEITGQQYDFHLLETWEDDDGLSASYSPPSLYTAKQCKEFLDSGHADKQTEKWQLDQMNDLPEVRKFLKVPQQFPNGTLWTWEGMANSDGQPLFDYEQNQHEYDDEDDPMHDNLGGMAAYIYVIPH